MKRQVTLKDIAKKFNVAISTVSRALHDSHEISSVLKAKIVAFANETAYVPNVNAQNLKNGHTDLIVVIVPFISSPFFLDFYQELLTSNTENNYNIILLQSFNNVEKEAEALKFALKHKATALIICPVTDHSNLELLKNIQTNLCSVMIFDRVEHKLDTDKVGVDYCREVYLMANAMNENGCQSILLLCCGNIGGNPKRIKGYKKAIRKCGHVFDSEKIQSIHYGNPRENIREKIEREIDKYHQLGKKIDGIISTTDSLSIATLELIYHRKLSVLHYGFCNSRETFCFSPHLNSIALPARQMAMFVWKKLENRLQDKVNIVPFTTKIIPCLYQSESLADSEREFIVM